MSRKTASLIAGAIPMTPEPELPTIHPENLQAGWFWATVTRPSLDPNYNRLDLVRVYGSAPYLSVKNSAGEIVTAENVVFHVGVPGPHELLSLLALNSDICHGATQR